MINARPLQATYQKLFHRDMPDPRRGKLTANPSGKFWIPIPIARFLLRISFIQKINKKKKSTQLESTFILFIYYL